MERSQSQRKSQSAHDSTLYARYTIIQTLRSRRLIFAITIVTPQRNSPRRMLPLTHAHTPKESWAVPLVQRRMQREKRGMRDTELRFPLQAVSHKHEGRTCRKKRLFWDGCYRNIISKGAGTCMDVSIEIPSVYLCVCVWMNITCHKTICVVTKWAPLCSLFGLANAVTPWSQHTVIVIVGILVTPYCFNISALSDYYVSLAFNDIMSSRVLNSGFEGTIRSF